MRTSKKPAVLIAVLLGVLLAAGSEPGFNCNPGCEYPYGLTSRFSRYSGFEPHRTARWTPDGDKLVFGFHNGLYSVDSDGSNLRKLFSEQLTTARGGDWWNYDHAPTIAQKGNALAFATMRHGDPVNLPEYWSERRNSEIILSTTDGSPYERLTYDLRPDLHPALSPNGSLLAFVSDREGGHEKLYMINLGTYLSNPGIDPQVMRVTPFDVGVNEDLRIQ